MTVKTWSSRYPFKGEVSAQPHSYHSVMATVHSQFLFQAPRIVQEAQVRKPLLDIQCRIKSLGEKGMNSGPEILL